MTTTSPAPPTWDTIRLRYLTVDVFTHTRYRGNPLAIVKLPSTITLTLDEKVRIATEFNLSETVFIHEPKDDPTTAPWAIEIFIPGAEIPFAGHPTIGAACYVASRIASSPGDLTATLSTRAGPIPFTYSPALRTATLTIPHDVHTHSQSISRAALADLGFSPSTCAAAPPASPLVSIVRGMTFLMLALPSLEHLAALAPTGQHPSSSLLDQDWAPAVSSPVGIYAYVRTGEAADGAVGLRARMLFGLLEDPATGSAACALAAWWALREGRGQRFEITQGVEMERESVIGVEVGLAEGGERVESVHLRGGSVEVMEGVLTV